MTPGNKIGGTPGSSRGTAEKIAAATKRQDRRRQRNAQTVLRVVLLHLVVGEWFPPAGRRTLGLVLVRRCAWCRGAHVHRAASRVAADGAIRTGSCGRQYKIRLRADVDRLRGAA